MRRPGSLFGIISLAALLALAAGCDSFRSKEARIEQARAAMAAGDYRAASIELKGVLDSDPDNAEARLALAEASLAVGDADAADKEIRRALAAGLPAEKSAALQGRVMLALGQAAELLQRLNDRSLPVQEPEWSVLKADALVTVGETASAETLYRSVLDGHPEHVRATVGLALAAAVQGREQEALDRLAGFLDAHPGAAEAWLLRGEILSRASRYSEAQAAFEQASSEIGRGMGLPQQLSALTGLADAQLARGANDEARATLQRMRSLAGGATQTRMITARLALIDQDYASAVAQLQPVARAAPNFAPARFLLGAALLAQGNLEQAESHLSALVQMTPENVEARKLLAKTRLRLQRYDSAMQVLTPAMQGDAFDPELSSLLSEAKLQTGAQAEAIEILEQAALRDPGNVGVKLDLATAYIVTGRSTQAVELLRALPEVTGDLRRETLLVTALAAAKGPVEARREIERLIARHPQDVNILSLGAEHALSQADYSAARAYLERALAVEPSNPGLLETLARTEMRAGSLDAAEATLQRLIEVPGSRTAARLGLVEVARLRGNTVEARNGLEQIRAEDSGAVVPRLMLARLMLAAAEAAPAAKVLSEVVAIEPRDARLRLQVARLLGEFSRYDEAIRQVREAVEIAPGASEGWVELARMQLALNQSNSARESAAKAVAIDRDSVEAVGLLALLDLREKRGDSALNLALDLATRRPMDPRAAVLEGDVRLALGQSREAAQAFQRAMTLSADLQIAAKQSAAMRSARMANPEAPLARWVAERPEDARARTLLAEAYQLTGRSELAIEQYERLAANPAAGFAVLNNLAWLYYERGDDRAEATARRAYDLAADNPAVADTYGWILAENGKVAQGLEALTKAAKQAPADPDIKFHYAAALARSGETQRAMALLDEVLGSNTGFTSRSEAEQLRRELAAGVDVVAD
jgi:putative PEP-CTERM system TPR-repeat lipoprotein